MWNESTILMLKNKILSEEQTPVELANFENWQVVYIKPDKFKGSLRYATNKKDAEEEKFPELFRNLNLIEV